MKRLLIGLLAFTTLSAQASMTEINGPLKNKNQTYFEMLGDLYKSGTKPNIASITDIVWSGRCFDKTQQNEPGNSVYIIRQKKRDTGPIRLKTYEVFLSWTLDGPDYFDNLDLDQAFAVMPSYRSEPHDARIKSDSIEVKVQDQNLEIKSSVRAFGSFLVQEHRYNSVVELRCYYFKSSKY